MIPRCMLIAVALLGGCITGCSTAQIAQFETKVGTKRCATEGIAADSPQFEQCLEGYRATWEQEKELDRAGIAAALVAGTAVRSEASNGAVAATPSGMSASSQVSVHQIPATAFFARKLSDDLYALGNRFVIQTRYCHVVANYTPAKVVSGALLFSGETAGCIIVTAWRTAG